MSENASENSAMNTDVILEKEVGLSIPKAVRIASNQLREEILRADMPGEFLGSEEDLINRLSISRPTFRQVARLLELEQLLTIKRGPGGGFFSRRPSFQGIVHQATVCLVAHKATVAHLMSVGRQLICEAAVQADDVGRAGWRRAVMGGRGRLLWGAWCRPVERRYVR